MMIFLCYIFYVNSEFLKELKREIKNLLANIKKTIKKYLNGVFFKTNQQNIQYFSMLHFYL